MRILNFNQEQTSWQQRSSLRRFKRSDDNLKLPENFEVGQAVGGGDCFFDSVAKGLKQIKADEEFTVKLLRELCHKYALENEWVKIAVVKDARLKSQISSTVKDNDIWNAYLLGIRYTADDIEKMKSSNEQVDKNLYKTLTSADYGETLVAPIWGRSEIEGRVICEKYNIKLHVMEKHNVGGKEIWADQIIDKLGSRSIDSINYDEENTIDIVNKGHLHFEPVLNKQKIQSSGLLLSEDDRILKNAQLFNAIRKNKPQKEKLEKVKTHLNEGADVNAKDANDKNNTPLHVAVLKGELEVVGLLLEKVAKTDVKNNDNETPLDIAKRLSKQGIVQALETYIQSGQQVSIGGQPVIQQQLPQKKSGIPALDRKLGRLSDTKGRVVTAIVGAKGSKIPKLIDKQKKYPASGLKNTLHGNVYQLKLLMLFLKRGLDKGYSFLLATEMDAAEKFDDLVFQYKDESGKTVHRFLQAKHKQDDKFKKITINDLLTEDTEGEFGLQKYFSSYRKIKQNPEFRDDYLKDFIICTNIDFKFGDSNGNLKLSNDIFESKEDIDDILNMQDKEEAIRYQFKNDFPGKREKIVPVLKNVSDLKRLAKKLAEYIEDKKDQKIELRDDLFKVYHIALAEEKVIDIQNKKFHDNFTKNQGLSPQIQSLRTEILSILTQSKKRKHSASTDNPQQKVEKTKLNLSSSFGKIDSTLIKVTEFVKEITDLLNESKSQNGKIAKIDRSRGLIKSNIDKLVKHVLIEKDGKIQFNPTFFNDNSRLPGNLENFKSQLKTELKSKGISFSELSQYEFDIGHFPKLSLPGSDDKITDIEINDFLNHLVFAVNQPNEVELGKIIKNEIGKEFNYIDSKNVYSRFQKKMLNWMKEKEGYFLSHEEGSAFFEKVKKEILGAIWFDVSDPVELFTGREEKLNELHEALQRNQGKDKLTMISQMTSISGLGGVGKSELARKYARDYGLKYYDNNVIWINAEKYETMVESFLKLARDNRLGIPTKDKDGKEKSIESIVKEVYRFFVRGERKSLFIFDNAERYKTQKKEDGSEDIGIDRFLPSFLPPEKKPYIMVTSRNQELEENIEMLLLDVFTEKEAAEFIRKALNIEDGVQESEVKRLAETLQCFPLALQQAVAYIKEESKKLESVYSGRKFSIDGYIKEYEKEAKKLSDFQLSDKNGYTRTTFITWKITLEKIKQREYGQEALDIMDIIAYFAPSNIVTKIFLERIDVRELGSALQLLKQHSMISLEQGEANIHRLVQLVTRIELKGQNKERDVLREALTLLKKPMEGGGNPTGSIYTSHAVSAWDYASKYDELVKGFSKLPSRIINRLIDSVRYEEAYLFGKRASKLLVDKLGPDHLDTLTTWNNMAVVLSNQGKYEEALLAYKEVYEKRKNILGPDHPSTLTTRNNIALVLDNQGKYEEALLAYKEVYEIEKRKDILGPDHPSTLTTRNNMAGVFDKQGNYKEALLAYNEVYEKRKDILGPDHLDTLTTRNNMAGVLYNQGKYEEALLAYKEVYEKRKDVLGPNHPDTLTTRNNMAGVLYNQGKYEEALLAYKEVYEKRKDILGSDHPSALTTRNNMALILDNQGKYEEALQIYTEVYEIKKRKDVLGPDHPSTLTTRSNMAGVLYNQGEYEEALQIYTEVYEKGKDVLGSDHPNTLTSWNNMAVVLDNQGKYEEALQIYTEVYEIKKRKDVLGPDHPDTLTTRNNMAGVLDNQGKYEKALQIYTEVYEKRKDVLGPDHPDTLTTRNNMAVVLDNQGKYEEALQIYTEVYEIEKRKDVLGSDHPDTLTTQNNMAGVLDNQGKYEEALQIYKKVYEKRKDVLGPDHPDTLTTWNDMAVVLDNQGKYEEALQIYKKVYEKRKDVLGSDHPDTLTTRNNMAVVLDNQGKYEEALQIYTEVYEIKKRKDVLGPDHPSTLTTRNNMAGVFDKQGNYKEALLAYKEVYEKRKDILGPDLPSTLGTKNSIALVLSKQGKYEEALKIFQEVYEKRKEKLRDHPDTLKTKDNIDRIQTILGKESNIQSNKKQQKAFARLGKYVDSNFPEVELKSVKQGLYLPSFESRNVQINGKCEAITQMFSQSLFLEQQDRKAHELFLSNLQTSAKLYERLAQGKQISLREKREIFDLSKLLDTFEQQLDSPISSLPSDLSHVKSYKTLDDLSRYIGDLTGYFAIHLVTSNHVIAIYRVDDNYAYFDSNVAFVSGLKNTYQLIRVLEKAVTFAGYELAEDGFLVEHFNVAQANNALTTKQKQTLTKPIQTERHLLSEQDQKLGHINLNGKQVSRVTLYDLGTKLHLEGSAPILINSDMNLSNENLLAYLNTGKISITAREYLESLRNNGADKAQEVVQTTKVIPFTGSSNEIKHAQQIQELLSSDIGNKLKSYELSNLLESPIEKSIKALPYYLEVAKTKHWPNRLTNAAGRIQLIRGVHGAAVSCDRERGNTKDCLLNTGEISLSLVSQLIEDKVVQNVPKFIKSLKTVKFGAHILRGGAAIISSPFDIYDIIGSAIDLHNCEKGSNECKDAIAGVTFASTSLASGVVLTAIGAPGVGTAVGLVIMVAQGAYGGGRAIEEFQPYRLTFDENFRLFWHVFALQPVPKDIEYIKARKDIVSQIAKQVWEQLQSRSKHIVAHVTGLGDVTFKEELECKSVQKGLDRYQACTHRKVQVPSLFSSNSTMLMDLSSIKGNDYQHFLSRVLPDSPSQDAIMLCLPAFSGKDYERDYTLSNGSPKYESSSTVTSYCENAMMVSDKQRMNQVINKKVVFDLNTVNQGVVIGSDKWQNDFIIYKGKPKVLGGENTRNTFILTSDSFAGTIFGGKNSTNILDVSNLSSSNYSLYIDDHLSSFDRTSYVKDYLANKKQVEEQTNEQAYFYGINNIVISANTTVGGNGDKYTLYIKPASGYSKINVSKGSIIFPETALLLDCDRFTYSPESNVLSMKLSNFTLDIANYFNRDQQICNFELIDKHGSIIEPLVDLTHLQEIKLFNLRAETDLTYNDIPEWYENIAKASGKYQVYGTVRVKYPIAQERYGFYPHKIFGSEKSDVIPLTKETWYAEGRKGSDSYNVISDRNSSITTEINNYAEDKSLDLLYMPVNSIQAKRNKDDLLLYATNSTHPVKVKGYFLGDNYQHLVVINDNKDTFIPLEGPSEDVSLVPFYHPTDNQHIFSLAAEKVTSNSEVIVDAKLDDIRFYRDGNDLLLMDDKPLVVKLENFYDKHGNLTLNFWHHHHKDKLSSEQLFELAKLAINYQDEIKSTYYDNVKEYIVSASNTTICHNQKFVNGSLTTVEPNTKRVGVLALQDPSDIEVSVDNEDLVFFVTQNNATFTIKNWNDTDHRISALKFNQEIKVTGLDKFDLSQVSEIQPLINKAVLSSIATQQLEKLDSNVVNGIKYLLAVRGIENGISTHKCLGFDSTKEEQQFISAYHSRYSSEKLSQVLYHNQASEALVWLVVKGYTDLSLENQSIDRKNDLNKCFNAVTNKRVISRIVRELEVGNIEEIIPNMESFIRHHKEALEDRIVNSLRSNTTEIDTEEDNHQRKRRDVRVVKDYKDYVFFNAQNNANSSLKGQQVTSGAPFTTKSHQRKRRDKSVVRGYENNNGKALFYGQNNANSSLKGQQVTSGGNKLSSTNSGSRPSSWINDFVGWVKNSITGFLAPSTEQVSSNIVQPEISNAFVDGFLILSDVGIRKFTGNKYKQPKHDSLLSPKELIEQRMDHTAINAINSFGKVYDFQNATSKVYDKPMTCLSSISLEKAVINMDSKKGIL